MDKLDKRTLATTKKLNAALERLVSGHPALTDGRLTPGSLAKEAGVGRATVYRFPEILEKMQAIRSRSTSNTGLFEKNQELKSEISRLRLEEREEIKKLRDQVDRYAQHIQLISLALEREIKRNAEMEVEIATLKKSITADPGFILTFQRC